MYGKEGAYILGTRLRKAMADSAVPLPRPALLICSSKSRVRELLLFSSAKLIELV